MRRTKYQVTVFANGERAVLGARSPEHLVRLLEEATMYTTAACHELAGRLYRGWVVVDPERETIVVPGDVMVFQDAPELDDLRVDEYWLPRLVKGSA